MRLSLKERVMRLFVLPVLGLLVPSPALTQNLEQQVYGARSQQVPTASRPLPAGRIADAGTGQIGQRQTRTQVAPHVEPLGRIQNRVANRVQNRIRNRIDRDYDPTANAASPFRVAGEQARRTPR